MSVAVYIDGFNLYYGLFENKWSEQKIPNHHKWLNLEALADSLVPGEQVTYIGYFTAFFDRRHQGLIPRKSSANVGIWERLNPWIVWELFREASDGYHIEAHWRKIDRGEKLQFWHFEEKKSDVNLAAHLVRDACQTRWKW